MHIFTEAIPDFGNIFSDVLKCKDVNFFITHLFRTTFRLDVQECIKNRINEYNKTYHIIIISPSRSVSNILWTLLQSSQSIKVPTSCPIRTIFLAGHSNFKKDFTRVYESSIYSTSLRVLGTYVTFFPLQIPTLVLLLLLLYTSYIKSPWNDKWKESIIVSARNVFGSNEKYNKPAAVWRYHIPTKHYIILLIVIIYRTSAVKTNFSDRMEIVDRCRLL